MGDFVDFRTIKQHVSIEAVLNHYNIRLRRVNQNSLRGQCPLPAHSSEKSSESFSVQTEKNIWACQSASCAASRSGKRGGNVIDFVGAMERSSVRDAAVKLHNWFLSGSSFPTSHESGKRSDVGKPNTGKLVAEKKSDAPESDVNTPLTFTLKDIDPTHPYLHHRGITEATAKYFGVGFFPGRGQMLGRIVIPISNERGELVAYAGRAIDDTEPKYKLPSGFKKSAVLYNFHRVSERNLVIVVEGFFGCAKVHQAGFTNVVALMGSSLSEEQEKFLYQFSHVMLFLDGDDAGRQASESIALRLLPHMFVRSIMLPHGEQPDGLSSDEINTILSS